MSGGDVPTRPSYLGSDRLDDITRMLTEVASELWILKDRTMVLEALLAEAGVTTPAAVEAYQPSPETAQAIAKERAAFSARIFGAVFDNEKRLERELGTVER
ncbi:hypothetical protein [Nocardioides yefusunii]|uniref:Uncharacterized protein n=1 Tax=Nocardioides yefusunii TaxID=2500546 RepID=A0ABW1QWA9_9ACTN|nr:hypothetical protein [Nocardioides yefusunii]